jgi:hypothetical protein
MIRKHRTGTLLQTRALQLLIRRCNGLPSPPSKGTPPRNCCPRCGSFAIADAPPWTCSACAWDNTTPIAATICRRINRIRARLAGGYALALDGADATSPLLTAAQRTALAAHLAAAVDLDDATELGDEADDE